MLTCIIINKKIKGKEMSRESLFKSESAAAIAIAAVLLLGLAFTIISVVKLNYAPEWKIDAERDYSYDAWSNMEDMKTRADILARFMGSDINYPYGLSATVPFSMGGGDVPVFEPSKSNSKLAVNTEKCTMSITLAKYPTNPQTIDCGGVTYYSENRQYPDQVFRYENGALILAQGENSQMKRNPSFDIKKNRTSGNYTFAINAINLIGEPASVSSSTSTALRLTGDSTKPFLNSSKDHPGETIDSFNISISTHYTDAWVAYLNDTAKNAELVYNTDYTIESIPHDHVCISFNLTGKLDGIYVNRTKLYAELGRRGRVLPEENGIMRLNRWYCFNKVSDSTVNLSKFASCGSGANFSVDTTDNDEILSDYNPDQEFTYSKIKNSPLQLSFGFNNYTEFKSKPSSATIRMIYRYNYNSPSGDLKVSGNSLEFLSGSINEWYLYNETKTINITDPSELTFDLTIQKSTGGGTEKNITIDYLAVRLN
jgi:hypothetical protein